jgi:uncharacterized protein YchJ
VNVETGKLKEMADILENEKDKFVEVRRDLTAKETADMQIRLYAPCGCGSGKKFKFCCHRKSA